VKKTKKSKTFRADITPGLSKDLDNLEETIGASTHVDLLKFTVRLWQRYEQWFYDKADVMEEIGVGFDRNVYKKTKGTSNESKMNRRIFGLMMFFSEMTPKQRKIYMSKLEDEGLTAKEILELLTKMED